MTLENESPPELDASEGAERGQNSPKSDGGECAQAGERQQSESTAQPDNDKVLEFLCAVYPDGPWVLTAIAPDRKSIETRTFTPERAAAAHGWIAARSGKKNLYWQVNPPLRELDKKAEREDIKSVCYLHVDVDPRAGEDLGEERARLCALFGDKLPRDAPKPTIVVFSGGGYQGFWKLAEPIPINGDLARAEDAKRYNQKLELLFGGDHCHDIPRIMRLPYTLNIPDAKKVAKGRLPAVAAVVDCDFTRVYPLSAFTPVPKPEAEKPGAFGGGVHVEGETKRIDDLTALDQWQVPDRIKVIIAQGHHPDEPKPGDNSRSAWLWDALCNLVRCGVPDEIIFAIIMDPAWPISASVLHKGSKARSYAIRQIERAKETAENEWLAKLNEKHFVVANDGGKCRVHEWKQLSDEGREQLSAQSFDDFRNRYMHIHTQIGVDSDGKAIMVPVGKFWLGHRKRRQFEGLIFVPGGEQVIEGHLNLWRGFGVEPAPGDWSRMQAHINDVLAAGDDASSDYILRWAAWAVQNPATQAEVALVFKGGQGTGKGTFARTLSQLFGQHGMQVTAPAQFAGRFNAHLRDVCLLFADEAVQPDDRVAKSMLKALLTEPETVIEGKGRDAITAPNFVKVVMASNETWIVPADIDDRRFAVFEVSSHRKQDEAYFHTLNTEIENGGRAAMLHDLLQMPLGNWHPRRGIPNTRARNEQKAASLHGFPLLFLDLLRAGEIPARQWHADRPLVATSEMQEYARRRMPREDITLNSIAKLFKDLKFEKHDKSRPRGYLLPPLPEARKAWDAMVSPVPWDDTREWATLTVTPEGRPEDIRPTPF